MDATYPDQRVPETIGRYRDLHVLGRGGMGVVYRAYDPELDRPVAIKLMLHSTPDFIARFRREAQSIGRLTHGNVVQVFDFGVDEHDNPYFVMELVEGTPLDALLLERGALAPGEAVDIARQAAQGLAAAHRAGIIHRDVKPSNLIVDARGGVKLVDFGIARASAGAQLTTAASLMGTPGYMAPEQAQGKPVDARADIYALGLTLFEMLAGEAPFRADDPIALVVMNMQEPLPDLRMRNLNLPEDLIALVEQMAKKSPDDRVQSCDAVVRALDELAGRVPTNPEQLGRPAVANGASSVPPTNVHNALPTSSRRGVGLALGVAILVGGVGVTLVLTMGGKTNGDTPKPVTSPAEVAKVQTPKTTEVAKVDTTKNEQGASKPEGKDVPKTTEMAQKPEDRSGPLRIAVLKFQNVGKDPELDSLTAGIGETVLSDMSGVGGGRLRLIERADIDSDIGEIDRAKDEHFDKKTVAMAGNLEGVHIVVQGGFQKAGAVLRVTARFVRVSTGEILDTVRVDGKARKLLDVQDQVSKDLKTHLMTLVDKERPPGAQNKE